jgi:hypothetical protein
MVVIMAALSRGMLAPPHILPALDAGERRQPLSFCLNHTICLVFILVIITSLYMISRAPAIR